MDKAEIKSACTPRGRLVILGSGITAIAHMTLEALGHIRNADIVFYNANSGVTAAYLKELNSNVVDLYAYYGEGKLRGITYVQMTVAGVFHGHPGFFVKAGRRAMAIAEMEGHEARLLPGISSIDCLFADLRVDPGYVGVEIVKASHLLHRGYMLSTDHHIVIVQVGSVGDNTFSFSGFKHAKVDRLFRKLMDVYGDNHESVYYVASIFPGLDPIIRVRHLRDYLDQNILDTVHASLLYIPPLGVRFEELRSMQTFREGEAYGRFEKDAIAELDSHTQPEGFKHSGASTKMLQTMNELATSPQALRSYLSDASAFAARNKELTDRERRALASRETTQLRSVMTEVDPKPVGTNGSKSEGPLNELAPATVSAKENSRVLQQ
jgi:precorrin-6B methylase 1